MILEAASLGFAYGSSKVLSGVNLRLGPGLTAIVGPNAAGKSTLLKCLGGLLRPEGRVSLDGKRLDEYPPETLAGQVAHLPQTLTSRAVLTVFEAVLLGRLHHLGWRVGPSDVRLVEQILDELGLAELATRYIGTLSGGQYQMVAIAQALVREPAVLLMDEPTSSLDLRHQLQVCQRIREFTDARGMSTVVALHDLNLAARFADTVCILRAGSVWGVGSPGAVLTEEMIRTVYRVRARVQPDEQGRPAVTILGLD